MITASADRRLQLQSIPVSRTWAAPALFATLVLVGLAAGFRARGPHPAPADAPATIFSAARAFAVEQALLSGVGPHPVGTQAHELVRQRIESHLRSLGYEVAIQRSFACNAYQMCSPVENLLARQPGAGTQDTLLVVAHYDSVPAGPGASDDGIGVSTILETARALRNEHFRNPVLYLITDSEESGLIGAEAFMADPVLSRQAAAVINVEARGTAGQSFLFETSTRNEWLVRQLAQHLPRPDTSSLFFNIYELLPNDTDMTVFKRAGLPGLNFANIGGVARYHTRRDDLAHLTLGTLQSHGDHVLATTRALANADLRQTSTGNAVWFDVLSTFLIWWPAQWSLPASILALLILLVAMVIRFRDSAMPGGGATLGVFSFFLSIIGSFGVGIVANWLAGVRAHGAVFVAQPGPAIVAMWLIGAAITLMAAARFLPNSGFDGLFLGHAICWSVISIVLAFVLPGAVYLTLVPAMTCAILATLRATLGLSEVAVTLIAAAVAAVLVFPLALTLPDALGAPVLPAVALLVAMVTTTWSPLVASMGPLQRSLSTSFLAAAVLFVVMANVIPPYTAESPRHITLRYFDDGTPRWHTDALPPAMRSVVHFDPVPRNLFEWLKVPSRVLVAPAPALALPPPVVQVLADERGATARHLVLRLLSQRHAQRVSLAFRVTTLQSLRVNGVVPPPRPPRFHDFLAPGWHQVAVRGASEATLDLVIGPKDSLEGVILDLSYGLPPEGAALARARDASNAVPVHEGDNTTMLRRVRL